jgi:TPR repeat protein
MDSMKLRLAGILMFAGCAAAPAESAPTQTQTPTVSAVEPAAAQTDAAPSGAPGGAPSCGDAQACLARAAELDASDPDAASEAFYAACLGGAVEGCEQAGLRWQKQVLATADDPRSARIIDAFERSCRLGGGMHGCGNVGLAYFYGTYGVQVDEAKAVEYMTKSCEEGNRFVCRRLQQYRDGEVTLGVLPD